MLTINDNSFYFFLISLEFKLDHQLYFFKKYNNLFFFKLFLDEKLDFFDLFKETYLQIFNKFASVSSIFVKKIEDVNSTFLVFFKPLFFFKKFINSFFDYYYIGLYNISLHYFSFLFSFNFYNYIFFNENFFNNFSDYLFNFFFFFFKNSSKFFFRFDFQYIFNKCFNFLDNFSDLRPLQLDYFFFNFFNNKLTLFNFDFFIEKINSIFLTDFLFDLDKNLVFLNFQLFNEFFLRESLIFSFSDIFKQFLACFFSYFNETVSTYNVFNFFFSNKFLFTPFVIYDFELANNLMSRTFLNSLFCSINDVSSDLEKLKSSNNLRFFLGEKILEIMDLIKILESYSIIINQEIV